MPELVLPSATYKQSYLEAVREYQLEKQNNYVHLDIGSIEKDFENYVQQIIGEAKGIDLPTGYVPHTIYWLVDENMFLGRVDIRHELNDFLKNEGGHIGYDIRPSQRRKGYGSLALCLAIEKARVLGLEEILLTCDVDNLASNKIIQRNGGVLTNTNTTSKTKVKNRYWIK